MRLTIVLFSVLFTFSGFGQFKSFLDSNKIWVVYHSGSTSDNQLWDSPSKYSFHFFSGDTLIDGDSYGILWSQRFYYYDPAPWSGVEDDTLRKPRHEAYMREDQLDGKVYTRHVNHDYTTLTYDYGLQVGDTFKYVFAEYGPGDFTDLIVDSIFEVNSFNSGAHRAFSFEQHIYIDPKPVYIEGIGGHHGIANPFWSYFEYEARQSIVCVLQNEEKYEFLGSSCGYPDYVGIRDNSKRVEQLNILENPIKDQLIIEWKGAPLRKLHFVSAGGMVVQSIEDLDSDSGIIKFRVEDLASGIYFIVGITQEGKAVQGKFVKR